MHSPAGKHGDNTVAMVLLPSLRYPFRKPRGALVLVSAAAHRDEHEKWIADPGHKASIDELREICIERGFTPVAELISGATSG